MTTAKRRRRKGIKANYGNATPEDVARALHAYRPDRKTPDSGASTAD